MLWFHKAFTRIPLQWTHIGCHYNDNNSRKAIADLFRPTSIGKDSPRLYNDFSFSYFPHLCSKTLTHCFCIQFSRPYMKAQLLWHLSNMNVIWRILHNRNIQYEEIEEQKVSSPHPTVLRHMVLLSNNIWLHTQRALSYATNVFESHKSTGKWGFGRWQKMKVSIMFRGHFY